VITRIAIFEGRVRPGCEERFFTAVEERLLPLWRQFPQALAVRYYRIHALDPDARPIAMVQQIDYPSRAALEEAVRSPIRERARAVTLELMEMFDGRFYHLMSGEDS